MSTGEVYSEFLKERLEAQEARKASLEQRGIAVITTTGALATLLFTVSAVFTGLESYEPPSGALPLLVAVASAFLISGVLALATNLPLRYREIDVAGTLSAIRDTWGSDEADALARITATRGMLLISAQRANNLKSWLLVGAMVVEVLAVGLLAVVVGLLLAAA